MDESTEVMDRKAADNEYFHRDFHSSMNMGIHYVGTNYGMAAVREYLTGYTRNVYKNILADIKVRGLTAIEDKIRDTYEKEKVPDALETKLSPAGNELRVTIQYCPAVKHLTATGRKVSVWYRYTTEVVMETLAKDNGYQFAMEEYEESTGAATYIFYRVLNS